jgi:hypothetical protein
MAIKENTKITGTFHIIERDLDGNIISESNHSNLITNVMKTALADVLTGDYDANKHVIGYIAVGTGTTAPNAADTDMETQKGTNKTPVPNSLNNDTSATTASATFFFDSTESSYYDSWDEIGLFAANGTDLLTHAALSPAITFDNTKTVTVSYTITFS